MITMAAAFMRLSWLVVFVPAFLVAADVTGRVRGPDDKGIAHATVTLSTASRPDTSVSTGSDGRFLLSNIDKGVYRLRAWHSGYLTVLVFPVAVPPLPQPGEGIVITLPWGGEPELGDSGWASNAIVVGTVLEGPRSIQRASVCAVRVKATRRDCTTSSGLGTYSLVLESGGDYDITVETSGIVLMATRVYIGTGANLRNLIVRPPNAMDELPTIEFLMPKAR